MMKKSRIKQAALFHIIILSCVFCAPVKAGLTLAEYDPSTGTIYSNDLYDSEIFMGQTFKPVITGPAISLDLSLESYPNNNPDSVPLTIQIRPAYVENFVDHKVTDTILAEGTIAFDDPQFSDTSTYWVNIDIPDVTLTAGSLYGIIILTSPATDMAYAWSSRGSAYTDGRAFIKYPGSPPIYNYFGSDLRFRVNTVPAPGALLLGGLGAGLVGWMRRRRAI
jgi:hypothetical protein